MSISGDLPSCGATFPNARACIPPHVLAKGDLAVVRAPLGEMAINLPDGKHFALDGQLVRVLDVMVTTSGRMVVFRPEPWMGWDGCYPFAWTAVPEYFEFVMRGE